MNLSKLLTKAGLLNSAIIRREKFKQSEEYKYVMENSKDLDIFQNVHFSERFWFVYDHLKLNKCVKCGKPQIVFPHSQKHFYLCRHKQHIENFYNVNAIATKNRKDSFIESIQTDKTLRLKEDDFLKILNELFNKKHNYTFIISKGNFDFYHDLVLKTENILPFDINDFDLSKRLYIVKNNLTALPVCKFCGKPVVFVNRILGFRENCAECMGKKISETRADLNTDFINNNFNFDKYELLSVPKIAYNDPLIVKCKKCGYISKWYLINGALKNLKNLDLCKKCEHVFSHKEEKMYSFIKSLYDKQIIHKKGSRKIIPPYELDVYIPELKLAFEFDGLYWHSSPVTDSKKYHLLQKTKLCEEKGITLIHVFENEWDFKLDIVKSRIKNLLGKCDCTIYARKCKIKEVSSKETELFLTKNHIQGSCKSKINLGLFYEDQLISLMTFSKPRFNKKYEWELLRFCNKLNYHVPGAASKLLNYFEKNYNPKNLISYADKRWSRGNLYEKLQFKLDHESKPDYWYFNEKTKTLESRIKYQKHKLKTLLPLFDQNKTEVQNMLENGYLRIFDCGNLVYVKTY